MIKYLITIVFLVFINVCVNGQQRVCYCAEYLSTGGNFIRGVFLGVRILPFEKCINEDQLNTAEMDVAIMYHTGGSKDKGNFPDRRLIRERHGKLPIDSDLIQISDSIEEVLKVEQEVKDRLRDFEQLINDRVLEKLDLIKKDLLNRQFDQQIRDIVEEIVQKRIQELRDELQSNLENN